MFTPAPGYYLVEPIVRKKLIANEAGKRDLKEAGEVLEIGEGVREFAKVGDILFFDSSGVSQTSEYEGKTYYVVEDTVRNILGKYERKK